ELSPVVGNECGELTRGVDVNVRGGGDSIHEIAGHALRETRPADQKEDPCGVAGEVHRGLPGGGPTSDQDHVLSSAAPRLDGGGPVRDPVPFEGSQRLDGRPTVAGTRGDDDGPAEDGPPVLELQREWLSRWAAGVARESGHERRHRELRAELLGLGEAAPGEL